MYVYKKSDAGNTKEKNNTTKSDQTTSGATGTPKASTPSPTTQTPAVPTTQTTTLPAQTTTPNIQPLETKPWTYEEFQASQSTLAADKRRQELASQKPGDFTFDAYEKSDAVKQAEALLQQQLSQKPGAYQSAWQTQIDEILNKILNREKFTYDLNGDALYQQYKDQYMLQGQQAMMDTMGQAAAMTGGYGNSYAQTAGQQTYQGYLQQLNDRVPELYQLALNQYNQEGQDLYNQYGLYTDRENQDYGRYRDTVSDYYTELDRLTEDARYQADTEYGRYMDAFNMAYGQYRDQVSDYYTDLGLANEEYWNQYNRDYGQYSDDRNLSYQQNRDQVADAQWDATFQYQQNRDQVADMQWQKAFEMEEEAIADSKAAQRKNELIALMQAGYEPTKDELTAAGISQGEADLYINAANNPGAGNFQKFSFARTDDNGNYVFYRDGKEYTFAPGVNPYTSTVNPDTEDGVFDNGYQPNNYHGKPLVGSRTGKMVTVNGVLQYLYETADGTEYYWDDLLNQYVEYNTGDADFGWTGSTYDKYLDFEDAWKKGIWDSIK